MAEQTIDELFAAWADQTVFADRERHAQIMALRLLTGEKDDDALSDALSDDPDDEEEPERRWDGEQE